MPGFRLGIVHFSRSFNHIRLASELHLYERSKLMMIIDTRESGNELTFKVEGRLAGTGVATLEDCWRTAAGRYPHGKFTVDLSQVTFVDQAGALLLQLMDRDGVAFLTTGLMTDEVKEILVRNKK